MPFEFKPTTDKTKGLKDMLMGYTPDLTQEEMQEEIKIVPLDLIDDLTSFIHPFAKSAQTGLNELAESIKINGVLQHILLRKIVNGRYELLAGHRRVGASRLAGLEDIPAIIRDVNDQQAMMIVTDTNLDQRDEILPSERAKAYKMQIEALKAQGKRNDLIQAIEAENGKNDSGLNGSEAEISIDSNLVKYARDQVAEFNQTSAKQVSRHLRLNELIEPLLDLVDDKVIAVRAAVEISYLQLTEQEALYAILKEQDCGISIAQSIELHAASKRMELTASIINAILFPNKARAGKMKIKEKKPAYAIALNKVNTFCKRLPPEQAEKLATIDTKEFESFLQDAIHEFLNQIDERRDQLD